MQIYEVGGAVRDALLGLPVTERDYCVVGASRETMLQKGFVEVGRDFPVFLHPITKAEYALARKERKVRAGYRGFECDASPEVTLEEDLLRRDLTINAIAKDESGKMFDPYGGRADIEKRILRHVSPAFSEDPVRVLRLARFYARFFSLGFRVAEDTLQFVTALVAAKECEALSPERVARETVKAMGTSHPEQYFAKLSEWGVWESYLGTAVWDKNVVPSAIAILEKAVPVLVAPEAKVLAFLLSVLWQEKAVDSEKITVWIEKLALPKGWARLLVLGAKEATLFLTTVIMTPREILDAMYRVDAFRRMDSLNTLWLIARAFFQHQHPHHNFPHNDEAMFAAFCKLRDAPPLDFMEIPDEKRAAALYNYRLSILEAL